MRPSMIVIPALLFLAVMGCSTDTSPFEETTISVAHRVYQEYYYRGPRSESDTTFFYLTTNRADFDSLFMYIYFPNETVDTIPSADIAAQKVVSIVKYGNDMCDLELKEVYLFGEMLVVDYTSTVTNQDMSSFAAISLIIMTDADFKRILFLENGRQIRELKL